MINYKTDIILWDKIHELPMTDICEWLQIPIVKGSMCCPSGTHKDINPSCRVYDNNCHCFACGFNAGNLSFVKKVLNCSTSMAVEYIDKRTSVIIRKAVKEEEEIKFLLPWEMAVLKLNTDPLCAHRVQNGESDNYDILPKEQAFEIINDKFLENCPNERMFRESYHQYVLSTHSSIYLGKDPSLGQSPVERFYNFESSEKFYEALTAYEKKQETVFYKKTGIAYTPFSKLIEKYPDNVKIVTRRKSFELYNDLTKKIENIINRLEVLDNDRECSITMDR